MHKLNCWVGELSNLFSRDFVQTEGDVPKLMHRRWKLMQRKWNCKTKHHVCLPNTSFCRLLVCQFVMQCNLIWKTYSFIFDKSERNRAAINGGADFNRVIRNHAMTLKKMKFPDRQAHLNQSGINERQLWFEISLCMSAYLDYRCPVLNLQRRVEKDKVWFFTVSPSAPHNVKDERVFLSVGTKYQVLPRKQIGQLPLLSSSNCACFNFNLP